MGTERRPDAITTELAIDASVKERLQHLAETRQQTVVHLMREAVVQYVEREDRRESFRRDTFQSLEQYQESGLHVTEEEVTEWLKTWGKPEEKPAPTCHR